MNDAVKLVLEEEISMIMRNLQSERRFEESQIEALARTQTNILNMESKMAAIREVLDAG